MWAPLNVSKAPFLIELRRILEPVSFFSQNKAQDGQLFNIESDATDVPQTLILDSFKEYSN